MIKMTGANICGRNALLQGEYVVILEYRAGILELKELKKINKIR